MRALAVAVLGTAALLAPRQAVACVCSATTEHKTAAQRTEEVRRELQTAVAVFSGDVIGLNSLVVRFKVEAVWRGQIAPEFAMSNGMQVNADGTHTSSSCDFSFEIGKAYVVFAFGKGTQDMRASSCTLTASLPFGSQTVMFLDTLTLGQRPAGTNSARTITVFGHVAKPGLVEWAEGMTVRDAIERAGGYQVSPALGREPGIDTTLASSTISRRNPEWSKPPGVVTLLTPLLTDDNLWVGRDIR